MKKVHYTFFFLLLIAALGVTNSPSLSFVAEPREWAEEEGCYESHIAEDEKIKHVGAGGNDFDEKKAADFKKSTPQPTFILFLQPIDFFAYFSFTTYHNYLFRTLYFPKLYILFHCTKAFLS